MDQWLRKGFLSPKQWAAAERNADRVDKPKAKGENKQEERLELIKIMSLFAATEGKLKNPKFRYKGLRFKKVTHGNHAGNVFIDRGEFGTSIGKINQERYLIPFRGMKDEDLEIIKQLEKDPVHELSMDGKELGTCRYCSKELEDERSVSAGYGPVCAVRWNLPWGDER
jgi:hypothetical protein